MKWTKSHHNFRCRECGFEIYLPIVETNDAALGLYDDDRFPGRTLLVVKQHFEHLDELPEQLAMSFASQTATVGQILRNLGLGSRINYAVLGNEHPHVHSHIIPRQVTTDVIPTRPVWEHPRKAQKLDGAVRTRVIEDIQNSLLRS